MDAWYRLKSELELAVEEGIQRGYNYDLIDIEDEENGGKFYAYRYVLDLMNKLEKGED